MSTNLLTRESVGPTIPPPHHGALKTAISWPIPFVSHSVAITPGSFYLAGTMMPFNWQQVQSVDWKGNEPTGLYAALGTLGSYADATTTAERAVAIIDALGRGELEQGVYDRPQPILHPLFPGPSFEDPPVYTIPIQDDEPEFVGIYGPRAEPTDWDEFYDEYKVLNPEPEEDVAFWDGVSAVVDVIQGQAVGGGYVGGPTRSSYAPMGAPVPAGFPAAAGGKVTVDTKTGKVTPCRRRRRRRLLTPTDLNDLAALKTIVGGGQSMNFAVMKAVRR